MCIRDRYCGNYFSYDIGYDYKIYTKNDSLYLHDGEHDDAVLIPIGLHEFRKMYGNNRTTIRFGEEKGQKAMFYRYGQRPPTTLLEFTPADYSEDQLNQFVGRYQSKEVNVIYKLKVDNNVLQVFLDDKMIVAYNPLAEDLFNSDHDGYLRFERGQNNEIKEFTITDYFLGSLSFYKL